MKKLFILFVILLPLLTFGQELATEYRSFHVGDSIWDDLVAPATTIRQGATTKPDFNTDSITLDFPYNDSTEVAYISYHVKHRWKIGSDVEPHLHYLQNESDIPEFRFVYRWLANSEFVTAFDTLTSNGIVFPYTSGSIEQILTFPTIVCPAYVTGVSSQICCKCYRVEEATITSDVQVLEIDIHYQIDSNGSDLEYSKTW